MRRKLLFASLYRFNYVCTLNLICSIVLLINYIHFTPPCPPPLHLTHPYHFRANENNHLFYFSITSRSLHSILYDKTNNICPLEPFHHHPQVHMRIKATHYVHIMAFSLVNPYFRCTPSPLFHHSNVYKVIKRSLQYYRYYSTNAQYLLSHMYRDSNLTLKFMLKVTVLTSHKAVYC